MTTYPQQSIEKFKSPTALVEYAIMQRIGAAVRASQSPDYQPTPYLGKAQRHLDMLRAWHVAQSHDVRDSAEGEAPGFVAEYHGRHVASYEIVERNTEQAGE